MTAFFKVMRPRRCSRGGFDTFFEHGQWWVIHNPSGASWSVVDAEGVDSYNGLGFERIDYGDEETLREFGIS